MVLKKQKKKKKKEESKQAKMGKTHPLVQGKVGDEAGNGEIYVVDALRDQAELICIKYLPCSKGFAYSSKPLKIS